MVCTVSQRGYLFLLLEHFLLRLRVSKQTLAQSHARMPAELEDAVGGTDRHHRRPCSTSCLFSVCVRSNAAHLLPPAAVGGRGCASVKPGRRREEEAVKEKERRLEADAASGEGGALLQVPVNQ